MSLRKKQSKFAMMVPRLIDKAFELGLEVTLGDAYRDPRVHGDYGDKQSYSSATSRHKLKLAIDLNLFKNGNYITNDEGHRELGKWWKERGGQWGGDFKNKDYNHYQWPL